MLKKSLIIATGITLTLFGIILYIGTLYGQYNPGDTSQYVPKNLGQGSRAFGYFFHEVGTTGTYIQYYGTQSVTGSGTTGYITGTSTALPHIEYNYAGGTPTFNFSGGTLQNEGVDVTVSSDLTGYIAVSGGTGTGNVLTNPTLAGAGTISANVSLSGNITANSLLITPAELSSVNNATGELQAQITTATGSITNHVHTGADGTAQIAHDSVTGTGTNSHVILDTHLASSSDPHGATLTQTAATIAGVNAPYIAQTNGTGTGITLAGNTNFPSGRWDSNGNFGLGTTTPQKKLHIYENLNNALESRIENPGTGTNSRAIYRMVNDVSTASFAFSGSNYSGGGRVLSFAQNDVLGMMQFWNAGVKALEFDTIGDATFVGTVTASNFVGNVDIDNIGGIVITSPAENHKLSYSGGNWVNATDTAIVDWSGITGNPTDNGSVSATAGAGYIPVSGSDGKLDYSWQKDVLRLNGTTTEQAAGAYGQLYVQSSSVIGSISSIAVGTNTTVLMTGNTAPSPYIARASTEQGVQYAYKAFDRNLGEGGSSYWQCANDTTTAWLSYDYGTGTTYPIAEYRIASTVGGANAPKNWTFEGSNDNVNWAVLDTRTNETSWTGGVYNSYTPSIVTEQYQFYRINITAANGGAQITILEMLLLENLGLAGHTQYSAKYIDPINGNTVFEILTPGTATTGASYIYNNATTTVFGLGTNTAITGTSTAYSGWFDGAVRATAFNVASTEKIKENLKPIKIKPDVLEAEATAKEKYKGDNRIAWILAYGENYTYVGTETGTGTVTYVDTAAMEADYADYIELAWASDLNQDVYIDSVQKAQEKYFWQMFDGIQPKSWNPKGELDLERKGFVVEEMPDVVKGNDKQSIDPMALIAYIAVSLQSIKQDNVTIMQALRDFAATGTLTAEAIEDRLEVLEIAP